MPFGGGLGYPRPSWEAAALLRGQAGVLRICNRYVLFPSQPRMDGLDGGNAPSMFDHPGHFLGRA